MILKEAWLPQADAACENMEVLRAAWVAFVGFEPEQEGEKP
jgi:CRISPR type III-associated protein (TIGR04423 family)